MAKTKSMATFMVADGSGGLEPIRDRRLEPPGEWPIRFEVGKEQADSWLQYFSAECTPRGWSSGGLVQLEAMENSGSIAVRTGTAGQKLAIVWERKCGGRMKVRARSDGGTDFPLDLAREVFEQASVRCQARATDQVYRRGQLFFEGLPWRGECWLDDTIRLGPPSQQDETALIGPRIILIDAVVECVGTGDAAFAFDQKLRELSVFLSVVMGISVRFPDQGRNWTYTIGAVDCAVRNLGYWQEENPQQMPAQGTTPPVPLRPLSRPDFAQRGIDGSSNEQSVPKDIAAIWERYRALPPDRRKQFLQAAAKWQQALGHWGAHNTLSFALMVVACEALKPPARQFRDHNIYQIVEALIDKQTADHLQEESIRAQQVRNAHLHSGEFRSSEFAKRAVMSSYQDPTFDQACRELAPISQAAIIEWLRRDGTFTMPPLQRRKSFRRLMKEHLIAVVATATVAGVMLGIILGSLLQIIYFR